MAKLTKISSSNTTQTGIVFLAIVVVAIALIVVQLSTFETVAYPMHEFGETMFVGAKTDSRSISHEEEIGHGQLIGPEDIVYEPKSGIIYTGCEDGWIKRVTLNDSLADTIIENWVHTGGRPLGLAIDESGDLFVADAHKGLLKVSKDGELEVLTDEAEGVKFGLTDAVVVAKNGMLYFTDATYKYNIQNVLYSLMEGRPHGRVLSYDPSTKQSKVLVRDLHFANGIELSPNQDALIFCETFMRRCSRYYLQGEKEGTVDVFTSNLPGLPDNIHYDGNGHYWIGQLWDNSFFYRYTQKYEFIRKIFAFTLKHLHKMPDIFKFGGLIVVDLEGKPVRAYYDDGWKTTTSGVKIGDYLYMGSFEKPYILRLDLTQIPLVTPTS